jgi:hypothetical protein
MTAAIVLVKLRVGEIAKSAVAQHVYQMGFNEFAKRL